MTKRPDDINEFMNQIVDAIQTRNEGKIQDLRGWTEDWMQTDEENIAQRSLLNAVEELIEDFNHSESGH